MVFLERVFRSPSGVLTEIVGGELGGLAEKGAELFVCRRKWSADVVEQKV